MRRFKIVYFINLLVLFLVVNPTFGQTRGEKKLAQVKNLLEERSTFTPAEIQSLLTLLNKASKEDLPLEFLINRLKEGIARKAEYQTVYNVLEEKIEKLKLAKGLTAECLAKGIKTKDVNYSQRVLGELLERGLTPNDFKDLANLAVLRKVYLEDLVKICEVLVELQERAIPLNYAKEIISTAMVKKMPREEIERTAHLLFEAERMHIPYEEAKNLITEGINKGRSSHRIKDDLEEMSSEEKEILRKKITRPERREISEELREKGRKELERR